MEKIFISSVQNEFSEMRKLLADYLRNDPLLGSFFEPFIFEEVPANTNNPSIVYSEQVVESNIYIGLFGGEYGHEDSNGISPTEREYDIAKENELPRWIFIKDVKKRNNKELELIKKIEQDVSRKKFHNLESLKHEIYRSCILYLQQKGKIVSHDFDDSLHTEATVEDLDENKVNDFIKTARLKRNFPLKDMDSADTVLQHLRMIRGGRLVNSALLVFATDPQLYFPTATIKCAHFHGINIQKPIPDYKEYSGTVFEMAESAVDFVLSKINLSTGTRSKRNEVDTVYEIPRAVIAEAIINAVAHRDYKSNGSIQISVFKNRIEISNPGSLPPELNIADLKRPHSSYPANPLLAGCMFLTGAIERYGTGTIDIYGLVKEKGLKAPAISLNEGVKLTLWRVVRSRKTESKTDYDTDYVTDYDKTGITEVSYKLLIAISGEMSRKEIMDTLELKHAPTFRDNYLEPTLNKRLIELTIPDKPKSKNQKYRLTQNGKVLKKKLEKLNKGVEKGLVKEHTTDYDTDYVTDYDEIGISDLKSKLLSVLSGEMSRQKIMDILGLKNIASFRDNYLNPALADEFIAMTIPDKPKSKNQKYRLTILGEKLKKLI